ncbi:hypothetical protein NQ315_001249 [Exocentrus adspersus]|uniref:protein xylosyltransferase n=1 Tax=Exocentrus adspersus TaxID=1586481 RepID=A0AAV8WFF2_9CUCU|nr:hypothetical protein NQ315_001249 [Exocentrus adspersus]
MVKNGSGPKNNKWMRRYRTFFLVGCVILCLQIYLAARFLALNRTVEPEENQWRPLNADNELEEAEANSAGRSKLFNPDDEDVAVKNKAYANQSHALKYDELEFTPPCQITTKEAVSAINRAKTQKCKQLISNVTCLSYANQLYPQELEGSCPAEGFTAGKELGCFKDEKNFRLLNGYFGVNKNENSPRFCMKLCLQSGFPYAGVEYSNECFCGADEPPSTSKIPDSSCNLKCPGDQHATCGGYYTVNIYQTGIKKFVPQIASTETSVGKNNSVKIVFLLTLNGRAVRQVKRLLKILYHKQHYYYIHVDIRQDYLYRELLVLEKQLPNVRLTRRRFATIWGGASLLEMLRSCMWELLNIGEWRWDFVLNLSESDFPVKTVAQLTRFLTANRDRNFVKSHGREVQRFIQKQGLDKTFVECETRMWRVGDRKLPYGIQVDGGSDWIALSRKFVRYVSDPAPDALIAGLLKVFRRTLLPAESFFHTALRNSKFCDSYVDNNLHVTNWKRKLGCKCQYKHVVDWCGCSPNDFRPEDWPRIQNTLSRQLYFARKFEPIVNQAVILQLELWLYGLEKPSRHVANLHGYWQSLFHYQDLGVPPDDALLTLGSSIARQATKMLLHSNSSSCDVGLGSLLQVHAYRYNDTNKYSLFHVETARGAAEVAVKFTSNVVVKKPSPLMELLGALYVSSEYDQKEMVSRNFPRILSPFSEPVLVYRFAMHRTAKAYNLTCLWISPDGRLHDIGEFTLDEASAAGHQKPALKQPILPGVWKAKLVYKHVMLAQVKFLIVPLATYSGKPITALQAAYANGGSRPSKDYAGVYENFTPDRFQAASMEKVCTANAKRQGKALDAWIDNMVARFYAVEKICATGVDGEVCGTKVQACVGTDWSSFAPDPKSAIGTVNETAGGFDIW